MPRCHSYRLHCTNGAVTKPWPHSTQFFLKRVRTHSLSKVRCSQRTMSNFIGPAEMMR